MDINKILKEELADLDKALAEDAELTDRDRELIYGACLGFSFNISNRMNEKHTHHVCKCKNGKAIVTTCKCGRHEHKVAKPAAPKAGKSTPRPKFLTTAELAREIGKKTNIVQCYSYRHGLGIIDKKRRVRVFSQEDAETIRKHFQN
jgi:hypothetical protein